MTGGADIGRLAVVFVPPGPAPFLGVVEGRDPGGDEALRPGLPPEGVGRAPALADQARRLVERHSAGERGDKLDLLPRLPRVAATSDRDGGEVEEVGRDTRRT